MLDKTRRIFIASTYDDLRPFRDAAAEVVVQLGWEAETVGILEGLREDDIVRECVRRVGRCDACLLVMASRVGWVPSLGSPGQKSITHLEVTAATEANIPIVVFAAHDALAAAEAPLGGPRTPADQAGYVVNNFPLDDVNTFRAELLRVLGEIHDRWPPNGIDGRSARRASNG
jgi:hypothetical protein